MQQQPQQQPVDPDQIYQSFDHNLYKITGDAGLDNIMDILNADTSTNNSSNVQTLASDIGGGVAAATTTQATGAATQAGKQNFSDTASGYWLGVDPATGIAKFNIGNSTNYITWDGTTLTVQGGANVSSINIPDTTTASSFHVDTSGNAWWGANVASGYAGANAYILATGAAVFKNVQIGGTVVQYVISNSGIFSYGDGSDGTVTLDGSTSFDSFAADRILTITMPNNPANNDTWSITFAGTTTSGHFVSSIGSNPGNVLIGASASVTAANLAALLSSPSTTNANQVALGSSDQTNVAQATYSASTTTITCTAVVALSGISATFSTAGNSASGSVSSIYALTRDVYFSTFTINSGITLNAAGWRIFCSLAATINGTIDRSGNNGGAGFGTGSLNQGGGTGGAALPDGYLKGAVAGANGGGVADSGINGTNVSNSIGVNGAGGNGSNGGIATPSNVKLIANWHLATLLDVSSTGSTVKFNSSASSGGAAGTGAASGSAGGGGGATAGGIIAIYARSLIIGASGVIQANGGTGGQGGFGGPNIPSGAGGGGGGSGGVVVLVYNVFSNSGSVTATAGIGGLNGAGGGSGAGSNGNPGVIYEFQLSL